MLDFTSKAILVCGVHKGGMGGATCRTVARLGGTVIALDKEQSYVDDMVGEIRAAGGAAHGMTADLMDIAQCETIIPTAHIPGMWVWRETLFAFLQRNAEGSAAFFGVPTKQVVEFGTEIEI